MYQVSFYFHPNFKILYFYWLYLYIKNYKWGVKDYFIRKFLGIFNFYNLTVYFISGGAFRYWAGGIPRCIFGFNIRKRCLITLYRTDSASTSADLSSCLCSCLDNNWQIWPDSFLFKIVNMATKLIGVIKWHWIIVVSMLIHAVKRARTLDILQVRLSFIG